MARALLAAAGRALMYQRRTYSSTAVAATKGGGRATESTPKRDGVTETAAALNPSSTAWVPDPVTGYYRPVNRGREMDAADMRERFLSRK